ncbi:MAG: CHAT domain-containing protein [Bacteroidia bacterium]|nr:CHAT domain-containing protein [Bacteroidia bacterium]
MKDIHLRSLYFSHVLSFTFLVLCTACQQESSHQPLPQNINEIGQDKPIDTILTLDEAQLLYEGGEAFLASNKRDSSLYYHEKALVLREKVGRNNRELFDSYIKVGRFYLQDFKYDVADKYYEKAQLIIRNFGVPVDDEINFLLDLTSIKTNLKDIPTAIAILNRLLNIVLVHRPNDKLTLGKIYHSTGNAYYTDSQFEKAILNCTKAAAYFGEIQDYMRLGVMFSTLGVIYSAMDENKNAIINYRKAIQNHLKWSEPESNQLAIVYLQKAFVHQEIGQFDSAQYYLQWNLRIRRKVYGEKDPNTFGAKFSLGKFYTSIGCYDSAVKYSQESLISLVKDFNDHNIRSNPIAGQTELNTDLVLGLVTKANALKNLSEHDLKKDYFDLSLNTYLLADSVFTIFRRNQRYDDPQLRELEMNYLPYHQMMELTFSLHKKSGNIYYLKKAIEIMEQSRAVLLESALNRARQYDTTGANTFNTDENTLIKQRSEILHQLSMINISEKRLDSLREELLSVDNSFSEWKKVIEKSNPNYFNLKYNQKTVNLEEIQSLLKDRNSILLEFLWSDKNIYALAIGGDTIKTKIIQQTDSFKVAYNNFVAQLQASPDESIKQENFDQYTYNANVLYQELINDLLPSNLDSNEDISLIISATGPMASIPFEALVTQMPQSNDVNYKLPYLIHRYPISYAYSTGILLKQSKSERDGNKLLALGFAGNGSSRVQRNNLSNLPGTEKEINSIRQVMKNNTNKYYLESEASETTFKKQAADFDIIHLAIHGVADSTNALKSKLVFRSEADTIEDSNLYAHELYTLNLNKLDLAVLSACESGIGKQQAGEGVMSIARGFAYAGCPSLVISLWKIDDRTSAQVMGNFYKYISAGDYLDFALAASKSEYIRGASEFNSHPAYWAAFLQIGDTRGIEAKMSNSKLSTLAFIILSIASLLIFFRWIRISRARMLD